MLDPESRPRLRIAPLLRLLHDRGIDWVLSGSTVLAIYGAQLEPNDLDVVPDLDPLNLRRLAGVSPSWARCRPTSRPGRKR